MKRKREGKGSREEKRRREGEREREKKKKKGEGAPKRDEHEKIRLETTVAKGRMVGSAADGCRLRPPLVAARFPFC
eukprot:scaffold230369_cov19-Tisochrysis_lutea.AAC.1